MNVKRLLSAYDSASRALLVRIYAAEIPKAGRRQAYRTEHFAALDLLGAALAEDFDIRHVQIQREDYRKPQLIHPFLHMNLSHCKGLAVCAAGTIPLGIDAETPREAKDTMLRRVCTPDETAWITQADHKNLAFSRIWTLKEAYAKYTGDGLGMKFSALGFSLTDGISLQHPAADTVQFFQLMLNNQWVVSLCMPRTVVQIAETADGWELMKNGN